MKVMTNSLVILVSKQCDLLIDRGEDDNFILQCYTHIDEAFRSKQWSTVKTNSVTVAAAFGLRAYPSSDEYEHDQLYRKYVASCTNVLALWGGGPRFARTLRAALQLERRLRVVRCDTKSGRMTRIPNSAIADYHR